MKKVDMSEQAVLRRLKKVDQLRELCLALMKAKKLTPEESIALKAGRAEKTARETPDGQ
jgi:predicted transcriptional regulator